MRDATRLAALALLLVGVTALLFEGSARRGAATDPWSSHQAGPDGTRALALLLEELGHEVVRRHLDLAVIEDPPALIVSIAPDEGVPGGDDPAPSGLGEVLGRLRARGDAFSEQECDALLSYLDSGGRVLLLASRQTLLASALDVTWDTEAPAPDGPQSITVVAPDAVPTRARLLRAAVSAWLLTGPDAVVLAQAAERPVLVRVAHGQGVAVLASVPGLTTNRGLRDADNALLLADIAAALAPEGPIELDEAHHGLVSGRGVSAYLRERGLAPVVAQLLLIAGLAVWWLGRRRQEPADEEELEGESPPDLVLALAETYRKGRHRAHATRRLLADLLRLVTQRHSLPPHREVEPTAQALDAAGHGALAHTLRALDQRGRAARSGRLREGALLAYARAVARVTEEIHGRR